MTHTADRLAPLGIKDEVAALKRERTIAAAVELFYERGYENTTLDAVAERLGVTKPFIYAYFSSKAELLAEICGRGISSSLAAVDTALAMGEGPTATLQLLSESFVASVLDNQKHIAVLTREEKNLDPADYARINEKRRQFDHRLTALLRQGVEAGEFDVADPHLASLAIGGLVSWAYVWYRPAGRLSVPNLSAEMAKLILALAGAKPKPVRRAARVKG
ncbi:MAG: TetR/AcrR family transcriptional regulator [Alsobacter sp.]